VTFEPNFERRLLNLAQIIGHGENSYDYTTNSQSFLPQLSFTNEEETGVNNPSSIIPGGLNISNISFNEPSSPINDKAAAVKEEIKEKPVDKSSGSINNTTSSY
jgi:hypothetical protein